MIFIDFFVDDYRVFFFWVKKLSITAGGLVQIEQKKKGIEFENVTHYFILTL
jgi:hypothetical protein